MQQVQCSQCEHWKERETIPHESGEAESREPIPCLLDCFMLLAYSGHHSYLLLIDIFFCPYIRDFAHPQLFPLWLCLPALTMSLTSFLIFLNAASACPNSSRTPAIFPPRLTFLVEMMILDGRAGSEAPRLRHCRCYLMQPNDRYGANNLLGSIILRYIVHIV